MQWDTRPPWPVLGFRGWAEEVHICAVLPRPLLLLLGAVQFRLLPECSLLTCSDLALGEPVITLLGVIWTVEQGRYEGMGEPVITLLWSRVALRAETGRVLFGAVCCVSLLCPHVSICGGDQSMGVACVHSCVRAWSSDVMWHFVCVVCGCVGP